MRDDSEHKKGDGSSRRLIHPTQKKEKGRYMGKKCLDYPRKSRRGCTAPQGSVCLDNALKWQQARQEERNRLEAFRKSLVLPFTADYGIHRVHKGDIFALVVHEDWRDMRSPFRVKYCVIGKVGDHWATYESDEHGNPTGSKGRAIIGNKLVGYLKTPTPLR